MQETKILCNMVKQGYSKGACEVELQNGTLQTACKATLKLENGQYHRVILAAHLSRPEDYFSIYQSGCNHNCLKCHSWEFSKFFNGEWYSTDVIAELCRKYQNEVTVFEPRKRSLMYYANNLCKHCGSYILFNKRSPLCPNKLSKDQILLSPQGFGPARNIIAFTGGDIACQADFYVEVTKKIKEKCEDLWVLLETNGFGLTPKNLNLFQAAGLDSYWLDIKAFDTDLYKKLCGTSNKTVLNAPKEIVKRNFNLEVLTVYIPNLIETDQFKKIAELIVSIDDQIPFHILAFFPQYKLTKYRIPKLEEIIETYEIIKDVGIKHIQIGNVGVFAKTDEEIKKLIKTVGPDVI